VHRVQAGQPGVSLDGVTAAGRGGRGARGGARGGGAGAAGDGGPGNIIEVESANPKHDAERLLRNFMKTAYRRSVKDSEVQRLMTLFNDQFGQGYGFAKSLLAAYTGALASPGFIFI